MKRFQFVLLIIFILLFIYLSVFAQDFEGPITQISTENLELEIGSVFVIEATISDSSTGNSTLISAEYFVDTVGVNGEGQILMPIDGYWDSVIESVQMTITLPLIENQSYTYYIHGQDTLNNWGDFDSVAVISLPDDDTTPPEFSDFEPQEIPYQTEFKIVCDIIDIESGIDTASVFLMWDNDGTVSQSDGNRVDMRLVSPILNQYETKTLIPSQETTSNFVYQVFAYNNDKDRQNDQELGVSAIQSSFIKGDFQKAYCYPNPAPTAEYGNYVHFAYYLPERANVTVEIYNVMGNIIETIGPFEKDKGMYSHENDNDLKWDISNVASDIYICEIISESVSSGQTDFVIKKLAVVK